MLLCDWYMYKPKTGAITLFLGGFIQFHTSLGFIQDFSLGGGGGGGGRNMSQSYYKTLPFLGGSGEIFEI